MGDQIHWTWPRLMALRDVLLGLALTLSTSSVNAYTYTYIEAESATHTAPMSLGTNAQGFGEIYIASSVLNDGLATFPFYISPGGSYQIWCRVLATNAQHDSFFFNLDNGIEDIFDVAENRWSTQWQWSRLTGRNTGIGNPSLQFSEGSHNLTLRGRETDTRLDQILITSDSTFDPNIIDAGVDLPAPWRVLTSQWGFETNVALDGIDSIRGALDEGSELRLTLPGPGTFSFWFRRSEAAFAGYFQLDDGFTQSLFDTDWKQTVFDLAPGPHQFRIYLYPGSNFIDQASFIPGPKPLVVREQPQGRTAGLNEIVQLHVEVGGTPPLSYQWRYNGTNVSDPFPSSYFNVTPGQTGDYDVVVTNPYGSITSAVAFVSFLSLPLDEALEVPGWPLGSGGGNAWIGQTNVTHDGIDAAQSTGFSHLEVGLIGPGTFTFWWKSETDFSFQGINFFLDGDLTASIASRMDWQVEHHEIPPGRHHISFIANSRKCWLDQWNYSGSSETREVLAIQKAIDSAAPGDTLMVPAGYYFALLRFTNDITLIGAGADKTTIDGRYGDDREINTSVIRIANGAHVRLTGVTITGGNLGGADGGGIRNAGYLTLEDCLVTQNWADPGWGGGMYNLGEARILRCTFSENGSAYGGGGIYNAGQTFLSDSAVIANTASYSSDIAGGGILNSGTLSLTNCTVSGNRVSGFGGGIENFGDLRLYNCTIARNLAQGFDSITNRGAGVSGRIEECFSTIIANNKTEVFFDDFQEINDDIRGTVTNAAYSLLQGVAGATIVGTATGVLTNVDPLLGPLQDNGGPTLTHALLQGSPAIDQGSSSSPVTDQRGFSRFYDDAAVANARPGACDIGSFELVHARTNETIPVPSALGDLQLSRGGQISAVLAQPDGKVIVAGRFEAINGLTRHNIALLNRDGSLDDLFSPIVSGPINAMVRNGDSIFLGGDFQSVDGIPRHHLAKLSGVYNPALEVNWNPIVESTVRSLALSGTNLYVGGSARIFGARSTYLGRISTTGTGAIDPEWHAYGYYGEEVSCVAVSGTNLFAVIGSTLSKFSTQGSGLFSPNWSLTTEIYSLGKAYAGKLSTIVPDGTNLYLMGTFHGIGGIFVTNLARVDINDGQPDPNWGPNPDGPVSAILLQEDGLLVAGDFRSLGNLSRNAFGRVDRASGLADSTWQTFLGGRPQGLAAFGQSTLVWGDLVLGTDGNSATLTRLDAHTGEVEDSFRPHVQVPGMVYDIARQPDGKVIAGGDFTTAGNLSRRNLVRMNADGSVDTSWAPQADDIVRHLSLAGEYIYVAGDFTSIGGQYRDGLARVSIFGSDAADEQWNPAPVGRIHALIATTTNCFVGGQLSFIGGEPRLNLAKLDVTGSGQAEFGWQPNPNGPVRALALQGGMLYVGGEFTSISQQSRSNLASLQVRTGAANSWRADCNGTVRSIAVTETNVFVAGEFSTVSGQSRNGLAKLGLSAAVDSAWNPAPAFVAGPRGIITSISVQSSNLFASGFYDSIGGFNRSGLVKLSTLGAGLVETEWDPGIGPPVDAMLSVGEDLFIGGRFDLVSGIPRFGLAFLPVPDAPVLYLSSTNSVVILRSPDDGPEVTHFRVTSISNARISKLIDSTIVQAGDFVSVVDASLGLRFEVLGPNPAIVVAAALKATALATGSRVTVFPLTAASRPVFVFDSASYQVREGQSITLHVQKLGSGTGAVNFATYNGSAASNVAYAFRSGPPINFGPTETNKALPPINLTDPDFEFRGDKVFFVRLFAPSTNALLGSPAVARVTILDNDPLTPSDSLSEAQSPLVASAATAALQMTLLPAQAQGQWRVLGEVAWRDSGDVATGMIAGDQIVEFKTISPYAIEPRRSFRLLPEVTNSFTVMYESVIAAQFGGIRVQIGPEEAITSENVGSRGQWQREGEGNVWRNSGETLPNLIAGTLHIIRFKPTPGWIVPLSRSIAVAAGETTQVSVEYTRTNNFPGQTPLPLAAASVSNSQPYMFNGQIDTDLGFGSGVAVKKHVVLSAGHVLFDDSLLTFVLRARWYFQRHHGEIEPLPQIPRGWYVFEGYAAQRQQDQLNRLPEDQSSPLSQNLDAAALYFVDPAARQGYGGYLMSDGDPNEWLTDTNLLKMLVGYPVDHIAQNDQGRMHATLPGRLAFTKEYDRLYSSLDVHSFGGNSGGPLYVQAADAKYYPAAIYLGGERRTLVRAIDSQVVDLINRAEESAVTDKHFHGGGVTVFQTSVTAPEFAAGRYQVNLFPTQAITNGGAWRLDGYTPFFNDSASRSVPDTRVTFSFKPIQGYIRPASALVYAPPNTLTTVDATYEPFVVTMRRGSGAIIELFSNGITGRVYYLEYSTNLLNWVPLSSRTNYNFTNSFQDTITDPSGRRFYRIREGSP